MPPGYGCERTHCHVYVRARVYALFINKLKRATHRHTVEGGRGESVLTRQSIVRAAVM